MKNNGEPELYKSIVAYDGTDYHGFQRQAEPERTVQAALEAALRAVGWQEQSLLAAGRTDAGAHAGGQVVAYRLVWGHPADRLTAALNAALPPDVAVRATERAPAGFHPRFSASGRKYAYRILARPRPDPFAERFSWRLWPAPDRGRLQELADLFRGRRDFGAFGRAPIPGGHTVREVRRAEWKRDGRELVFTVEADAYLHRMVRRMVGAMVEVGLGRAEEIRLREALSQPQRFWNGRIAPARGLILEAVYYEEQRDQVAEDISSET